MAKEQGWIKLYRKLTESTNYFDEPFCKNMAWVDLLLLANHSERSFRKRGIKVTVQRGQVGMTPQNLADRWKWSRGKVLRFLKELEEKKQIVQQNNNVTSLLSILNYSKYQPDGTVDGTPNGTAESQKTVQQTPENGTAELSQEQVETVQQNSTTTASSSINLVISVIQDGTPNGTAESQKTVQQTPENGTAESQKTDTNKNDSKEKNDSKNEKGNAQNFLKKIGQPQVQQLTLRMMEIYRAVHPKHRGLPMGDDYFCAEIAYLIAAQNDWPKESVTNGKMDGVLAEWETTMDYVKQKKFWFSKTPQSLANPNTWAQLSNEINFQNETNSRSSGTGRVAPTDKF